MPNLHVYLPEKLDRAIVKVAKEKRRAKSDIIHFALVKEFLGEEELNKMFEEKED